MGLFDIFRRKSQKETEEEKKEQKTETPNSESSNKPEQLEEKKTTENQKVPVNKQSEPATPQKVEAKETNDFKQGQAAFSDSDNSVSLQKAVSSEKNLVQDSDHSLLKENVSSKKQEPNPSTDTKVSSSSDSDNKSSEDTTDNTYERGLAKSRSTFGQRLNALLANFRSVDESFFDDLEDMLIESDVGFETSMKITDELKEEVKLQNVKKSKDVQNVIVEKMIDLYDQAGTGENNSINFAKSGPTVLLFVGVNGVGKTTTIGKMAKMFKDQGKKVLLVAADTFRAGAIEQLNVWAQQDGVDIVKGKVQVDPSAAVYDGVTKAKKENYDILMVDTAGRLQNKVNLMNELAKMKKVLTREIPEAPHEILLVLDATTGQNALSQAKTFKDTTDVTGIVLTKLDGTARGGIVLAIRNELHLPVKYVGLGEKVTDLQKFDPSEFVYGLFKGLISEN